MVWNNKFLLNWKGFQANIQRLRDELIHWNIIRFSLWNGLVIDLNVNIFEYTQLLIDTH